MAGYASAKAHFVTSSHPPKKNSFLGSGVDTIIILKLMVPYDNMTMASWLFKISINSLGFALDDVATKAGRFKIDQTQNMYG